jgi:hypothetical protein
MKHHITLYLPCLILCLLLLGCGPHKPEAKTSGVVTFQGRPTAEPVVLTFACPTQGVYMNATTDTSGRFRMLGAKGAGLPPGEYNISIRPLSFCVAIPMGGSAPPPLPPCPKDVPKKYHAPETSGLTSTIKMGENVINFDMKP